MTEKKNPILKIAATSVMDHSSEILTLLRSHLTPAKLGEKLRVFHEKDIADAVNMFEEYSCDIAFGVCRSKGITIKLYEDMHHEICFVEKAEVRNAREYEKFNDYIEKLNEWQANELASCV